jgi:hypothetical protein
MSNSLSAELMFQVEERSSIHMTPIRGTGGAAAANLWAITMRL